MIKRERRWFMEISLRVEGWMGWYARGKQGFVNVHIFGMAGRRIMAKAIA
jgi:hypothetical protein